MSNKPKSLQRRFAVPGVLLRWSQSSKNSNLKEGTREGHGQVTFKVCAWALESRLRYTVQSYSKGSAEPEGAAPKVQRMEYASLKVLEAGHATGCNVCMGARQKRSAEVTPKRSKTAR